MHKRTLSSVHGACIRARIHGHHFDAVHKNATVWNSARITFPETHLTANFRDFYWQRESRSRYILCWAIIATISLLSFTYHIRRNISDNVKSTHPLRLAIIYLFYNQFELLPFWRTLINVATVDTKCICGLSAASTKSVDLILTRNRCQD